MNSTSTCSSICCRHVLSLGKSTDLQSRSATLRSCPANLCGFTANFHLKSQYKLRTWPTLSRARDGLRPQPTQSRARTHWWWYYDHQQLQLQLGGNRIPGPSIRKISTSWLPLQLSISSTEEELSRSNSQAIVPLCPRSNIAADRQSLWALLSWAIPLASFMDWSWRSQPNLLMGISSAHTHLDKSSFWIPGPLLYWN